MWIDAPENELVKVESTDHDPLLKLDDELLKEAMEISSDPEGLQQALNEVLASINQKTDNYMDLSKFGGDDGEFDADKVNTEAGIQVIANQLNKAFANFKEKEKATTDGMISDVRQIDGKVADILFDYRDSTWWEWERNKAFSGLSDDKMANKKYPWTKRINN